MNGKPKPSPLTGVDSYRKTEVVTANRETILLMMYSGAIRFLKRAMESQQKANIEETTKYIGKTQLILTELRSTLNFELDNNFASTMDGLYGYMSQRLVSGTLENKPEHYTEVLKLLTSLNESWEKAIENLRIERSKESEISK